MSGGGGGGETTTVQKSDPWLGQQGSLTKGFQYAQQLLDHGMQQAYPGQTVAPLSDASNNAVFRMASRGITGSPVETAAQGEAVKTLNGDYLSPDSNPYLASIAQRNAGDITSQVQSQFGAAGRSGSGINQEVLARSIGDSNNALYGGAYNDERGRMVQQLALAPQTSGMDYTNIGSIAKAGSVLDTQNQNVLDADVSKWNFTQQAPWDALGRYSQAIGGNYGSSGTSTSSAPSAKPNPWSSAAGGAMVGAQFGGPWGAAIGGGVGLLSSYL